MATNLSKLSKLTKQRKSALPAPPPVEEASPNLAAPEHAPVAPGRTRVDGRTLRKTNRTVQFSTRVTADFDARLRDIAQRDGKLLVKILEEALDAYEATR